MPLPERRSLIAHVAAILAVVVLGALSAFGWSEEGVPTAERFSELGLNELLDGIAVATTT